MIIATVPAMTRLGRILVVDDEANARTALAELLRDEGYEVETAADAFKALGKHESFAPHIVVTDLARRRRARSCGSRSRCSGWRSRRATPR
jgi:CheY-like chemotaxis protein